MSKESEKAQKGLDEFKERYPDIYNAVYDRGRIAGIASVKKVESDLNKIDDTKTQNFESRVAEYIAKGNSRGEAVRLAVKNYPELHLQYVERLKAGKNQASISSAPIKEKPSVSVPQDITSATAPTTFNEAVDREKAQGLSGAESIRVAVHKYPKLHEAYLLDLQRDSKD